MNDSPVLVEPSIVSPANLGCYLGSFDPPHRGHLAIVESLLEEVDQVLLLIPTKHFHKAPAYPRNATFDQRFEMLKAVRATASRRIHPGLTDVALFLELDTLLRRRFPGARVLFAMGDETFAKLSASADYFRRTGRTWDDERASELTNLQSRCRVWNRSGAWPSGRVMKPSLSRISSTKVRDAAERLWRARASEASWRREFLPLVPPSVVNDIRRFGLYDRNDRVRCAVGHTS